MHAADSSSASLLEIMQCGIEHCMQLLQVLHREHTAVTSNTPELLEQAAQEKLYWLRQVEALVDARSDGLRAAGVTGDPQSAAPGLTAHPDVVARWQQVQRILVECQRQNQINGSVIELSRRHTLRALSLLRGQSADQTVYSASGEAFGPPPPHMLATA
ncbi:MAG: flagellar protein FlgN [Gammaproteobacteria bacterium]|nr:flagellar protein FlgN [Gammaproteobacteria bacterium]